MTDGDALALELVLELVEMVLTSAHDSPTVSWSAELPSGSSVEMSGTVERVEVGLGGRLEFVVEGETLDGRRVRLAASDLTDWGWP